MKTKGKSRKKWIAAILSLFVTGLGHVYTGKARRGLVLYFLEFFILILFVISYLIFSNLFILYFLVLSLLAYRIMCIVDSVKSSESPDNIYILKKYNKSYIYILLMMVSYLLINTCFNTLLTDHLIERLKITGNGMMETIYTGDRVLANKYIYKKNLPQHGDVVIYYPDDSSSGSCDMKRVIALPGDKIELKDSIFYLNGTPLRESYVTSSNLHETYLRLLPKNNLELTIVPEGVAYLMGDSVDNIYNVRVWEFVDLKSIRGKAVQVYWSIDSESAVRWDRIGIRVNP